ncbi:MAG: hypothetical protein LBQ60_02415, partial [Bacteroidales bacterium]|nr:hypothetical protein [Bacteroidales bacterium]
MPKNEYLLRSYEIEVDNKDIKQEQLTTYVRQKPNKKIIGLRFHLWLFNRSKPEKNNKWNNWLRKNGEEPVIWQQSLTDRTSEQLKLSLENLGYYYATVTDTVLFKKKKANVVYSIHTGWPYIVSKLTYSIPDTAIARLIFADTTNTLIKPGILFDVTILDKERSRIETNLKNKGYYSFSAERIEYDADTTHSNRTVTLQLQVNSHSERTEINQVIETPYPLYTIRSLTVNASLSMQNLIDTLNVSKTASDTLTRGETRFIIPHRFPVKASTIGQSLYVFPDSLYRISDVNQTYQHLTALRNFRQVNIEFNEVPGQNGLLMRDLDCRINILPFTRQSYTIDLEGTNSDGNFGGAVSFLYQNKSLFGHAEIFDLRLRGMLEAVSSDNVGLFNFKTTMEYEAEASINIPKFILPFSSSKFIRMYSPRTIFSILYNYQRRPLYERSVFSTSFGYNWRGSEIIFHTVRPLDVNFVQLININPDFNAYLDRY